MMPLIQYCLKRLAGVPRSLEKLKENLPWTVADLAIHVPQGSYHHMVGLETARFQLNTFYTYFLGPCDSETQHLDTLYSVGYGSVNVSCVLR